MASALQISVAYLLWLTDSPDEAKVAAEKSAEQESEEAAQLRDERITDDDLKMLRLMKYTMQLLYGSTIPSSAGRRMIRQYEHFFLDNEGRAAVQKTLQMEMDRVEAKREAFRKAHEK